MSEKMKVGADVTGIPFRTIRVDMESDYYGSNMQLRVELSASASEFTKKQWGDLMEKLASGKVLVVVTDE